jgi:serine/threonine protein phosphatase PrpC
MHWDIAHQTKPGARQENEDALATWREANALTAIVADGLGGHGHGRRAADCVVNAAQGCPTPRECLAAAQRALLAEIAAHPECARMRSTAVVLRIDGNQASWAHCGDSRLYYFQSGALQRRTIDHSVPQMLALAGDIQDDEIRRHEDRNKLLSALGEAKPKMDDSGEPIQLAAGDAFLLATDGLWEHFSNDELEDSLRNSATAEDWLRTLCSKIQARFSENQDNYTALAIRILEEAR